MKIGLGMPESPFLIKDSLFECMGLLYLSSALKDAGHEVRGFRFGAKSTDEELRAVIGDAEMIGVTGVSAHVPAIRRMGKLTGIRKVGGGVHASIRPEEVLSWGFDAVAVGEAEALVEVLDCADGILLGAAANMDALAVPDRDLFPREMPVIYGRPAESVMLSRGCPYGCAFCSKMPGSYRRMSLDSSRREIEAVAKRGAGMVVFFDDCFTMDREWALGVAEIMGKAGLLWRISTRADKLDLEILKRMREAGLQEVCVGVESGSQRILEVLCKRTSVEENTEARQMCAKAGVKFKAYIMVGCPGEDDQTIGETMQWLAAQQPDAAGVYLFNPLPGSPIYERPSAFDIRIEEQDGYMYAGRDEEIRGHCSTSALSRRRIMELYLDMKRRASDLGIGV